MRGLLIAVGLLLGPAWAAAAPLAFEEAGVTMEVPTGWKATLDTTQQMLNVLPPDQGAMLQFYAVPRANVASALDEIEKTLAKLVEGTKLGEATEMRLNGMDAIVGEGSGTMDGHGVELGIMVLNTQAGRTMLFIGLIPQADAKKYEAGVAQLLSSIKPLAAKAPGDDAVKPAKAPSDRKGKNHKGGR